MLEFINTHIKDTIESKEIKLKCKTWLNLAKMNVN